MIFSDGYLDTPAATAESSLVVKQEKRDGVSDDVDDNLTIHFEDIAVQVRLLTHSLLADFSLAILCILGVCKG